MGTLAHVQDRQGDDISQELSPGPRERASHQARHVKVLADRAANQVVRSGLPVALSAMNDTQREMVREHLRWRTDLAAYSEGEGPERHVVVIPI